MLVDEPQGRCVQSHAGRLIESDVPATASANVINECNTTRQSTTGRWLDSRGRMFPMKGMEKAARCAAGTL